MDNINDHLEGDLSWINGRPIYVSMSGGKDSTAMAIYLRNLGIRFKCVFIDTGWEHPSTYDYIRDVLEPMFGKMIWLRNEAYFDDNVDANGGMEQLVLKYKMFPNSKLRFCTNQLKLAPVLKFYSEVYYDTKLKPISCVGIRSSESKKRSKALKIEEMDEATVWRPILDLSQSEVIYLHNEHSVPPNPLYLKGYGRVGCYPCIYASKSEIHYLSYDDIPRINHVEELERRVTELRGGELATFFPPKGSSDEPQPIAEVVKWSRTKTNVDESYDDIEREGCMRWGLCETQQTNLFDEINIKKHTEK